MRFIFLTLICNLHFICSASFDTIFTLNDQRADIARNIFNQEIVFQDSATATLAIKNLISHAIQNNKPKLEVIATGFMGIYYQSRISGGYLQASEYFEEAITLAKKYQLQTQIAEYTHHLGYTLCRAGEYTQGLKYILKAENMMDRIGYQNIYDFEKYLYNSARIYYDFGNYKRSVFYLKKVLTNAKSDKMLQMTHNALGIVYAEWHKTDSAFIHFEKMLELSRSNSDSTSIGAASTNLGMAYLNLSKNKKARPLLKAGYHLSIKSGEWQSELPAVLGLAELEVKDDNIDSAKIYITQASKLMRKYQVNDLDAQSSFYTTLASIHKKEENFNLASAYLDSLITLKDSIAYNRNINNLSNIESQLTAERFLLDIQLLEKEKKLHRTTRNVVVLGASLIIAWLAWLWFNSRKKHQQKHEMLEREKRDAQERLKIFKINIQEKNRMIEDFKTQLKKDNKKDNNHSDTENHEIIRQLHQSIILTEDDWSEFKKLFEKAYPGFLNRLRIKHPLLTVAEVRFLALARLNLSISEMGNMLGILPHSVRKTRQRLMKKLHIEDPKKLPRLLAEL